MLPVGPIMHSQVHFAWPSPETTRCSPCPTSHFLLLQLNIIILSTPVSSKCSLSFRFPQLNPVYASPVHHMRYIPAHLIPLILITQTILGEQYRILSSCDFLHPPITASILGSNAIQPIHYRILYHWKMSRNFKNKYFELQQFSTLGSASVFP